jgi:hypothetical protein
VQRRDLEIEVVWLKVELRKLDLLRAKERSSWERREEGKELARGFDDLVVRERTREMIG